MIIDRVPVSPFIRIRNQAIAVRNQNPVTLECEVEAFPEPTSIYWERSENRRLKPIDKYRMEITDKRDIYKVIHSTYIHESSHRIRVIKLLNYLSVCLREHFPLFEPFEKI